MKKIFLTLTVALIFIMSSSLTIYALEKDIIGEEIRLYLGETRVLPVDTPSRIVIGNPNIADVISVTENTITLTPKAVGLTTFVFWDKFGEQSYRIRVVAEDVEDIKLRIDNLLKELNLPNVYTKAAETEGKVLLLGEVRTKPDMERIDLALGPLKDKTTNLIKIKEEAIVDIDVQVLELDRGATKTLGFAMPTSIVVTEPSARFDKTLRGSLDAIFHVFEWSRSNFNATLNLLVEEGKARILSQPRLTCLSGKEAELLVGGEKPIMTTQVSVLAAGATTQVEYKEYGIKLKIKPTVTEENLIKLALNIEVSEVGTAEILGTEAAPTAKAYPLTKRNVSTELSLNDGQTMAIGGLIKQKKEESVTRTAFLSDIPIIGALFRKKETKTGGGSGEKADMELFITLTPTIVAGKVPVKEGPISEAAVGLPVETKPLAAEEEILPELKDYIKAVQLKIINAAYYPQEAKDLGWEGIVTLILRLASDGNLREVRVKESSGYKLLDEAAVEVVQKQAPYPAFPYQVKLEELRIQIPIAYRKN